MFAQYEVPSHIILPIPAAIIHTLPKFSCPCPYLSPLHYRPTPNHQSSTVSSSRCPNYLIRPCLTTSAKLSHSTMPHHISHTISFGYASPHQPNYLIRPCLTTIHISHTISFGHASLHQPHYLIRPCLTTSATLSHSTMPISFTTSATLSHSTMPHHISQTISFGHASPHQPHYGCPKDCSNPCYSLDDPSLKSSLESWNCWLGSQVADLSLQLCWHGEDAWWFYSCLFCFT